MFEGEGGGKEGKLNVFVNEIMVYESWSQSKG